MEKTEFKFEIVVDELVTVGADGRTSKWAAGSYKTLL
jgi:hypothetical protein